MAKTDIWMPLYIGSYLADTMHLETEEHGAYFLLLLYGWRNEGKIPADDLTLSKIAKLPLSVWRKMRPTLESFFDVAAGFWSQKRQLEELSKAASRRDSAKENGSHGGRPRNPQITGRLSEGIAESNPRKSSSQSQSQLQEETPPLTPLRGEWFSVPEFSEAWNAWGKCRKKKAGDRQYRVLEKLAGGSLPVAIKILNKSADNQWQGLFEIEEENNGKNIAPRTSRSAQLDADAGKILELVGRRDGGGLSPPHVPVSLASGPGRLPDAIDG